jgi:acyl carrier protein
MINEKLMQIFHDNGAFIDMNNEDFDLELQMDSYAFITLIVEIENQLDILIPEDYFTPENFSTFRKINDLINILVTAKSVLIK